MKRAPSDPNLLEHLAAIAGCAYLSDLHESRYRAAVHRALTQLEPGRYPVSQWRDTAEYLSCPLSGGEDSARIRQRLLAATAA